MTTKDTTATATVRLHFLKAYGYTPKGQERPVGCEQGRYYILAVEDAEAAVAAGVAELDTVLASTAKERDALTKKLAAASVSAHPPVASVSSSGEDSMPTSAQDEVPAGSIPKEE